MSAGRATAIVLAAGRGERMRPLTDACPKPLLPVGGRPLIEWHLLALAAIGVRDVVINTAWLGEQFEPALGDGSRFGLRLHWSHEGRDFGGALETLGGISRALQLLAERFWVVAGDVHAPFWTHGLPSSPATLDLPAGRLAQIALVDNPAHNPKGDFGLDPGGLALNQPDPPRLTYATCGWFDRALFEAPWCDIPPGNPQGLKAPLAPLLRRAMDNGRIGAWHYRGPWTDVGTPERLATLDRQLRAGGLSPADPT